MPTITITGPDMPAVTRRAIALQLTRWFSRTGVTPGHVIVRFHASAPQTVFSGGLPTEGLNPQSPGASQVTVLCRVAPGRSAEFKEELAAEISNVLRKYIEIGFFYLEFKAVSASDVYVAVGHDLKCAGIRK